jgi:hypothetical protein
MSVLDEIYATTSLDSPTLAEDLGVWLMDYSYRRVHGSLDENAPYWDDVIEQFDPKKEAGYVDPLTLRRRSAKSSKQRNDASESHT